MNNSQKMKVVHNGLLVFIGIVASAFMWSGIIVFDRFGENWANGLSTANFIFGLIGWLIVMVAPVVIAFLVWFKVCGGLWIK